MSPTTLLDNYYEKDAHYHEYLVFFFFLVAAFTWLALVFIIPVHSASA